MTPPPNLDKSDAYGSVEIADYSIAKTPGVAFAFEARVTVASTNPWGINDVQVSLSYVGSDGSRTLRQIMHFYPGVGPSPYAYTDIIDQTCLIVAGLSSEPPSLDTFIDVTVNYIDVSDGNKPAESTYSFAFAADNHTSRGLREGTA